MASVTLDRLYIHDAANLADFVTTYVDDIQERSATDGEVHTYSGGRRRVVRRADRHGRPGQLTLRCEQVDRTTIAQLDAWCGRRLLFRDPRGRLWWGVYFEIDVEEIPAQDEQLADVHLVVERLSGTAEV